MEENRKIPETPLPESQPPIAPPVAPTLNPQTIPLLPAPRRVWIPVCISIVLVIALSLYGMYLVRSYKPKPKRKNAVANVALKKPSPTPDPRMHAGKIAYEKSNGVYLYDTDTGSQTKLPVEVPASPANGVIVIPSPVSFSGDGNTLYLVGYSGTEGQLTNASLFAYDLSTQKTTQQGTIDLSQIDPNPSILAVSPMGHYVVIDTGTAPGNRGRILLTVDGKLVKELGGQGISWSPDEKYMALATGDVQLELPNEPPPTTTSLRLETIDKNQVTEKVLIFADHKHSYQPIMWQDAHTLVYEELTYAKEINPVRDGETGAYTDGTSDEFWANILEHPEITYWQRNVLTGETTQVATSRGTIGMNAYRYQDFSPDRHWQVYADGSKLYMLSVLTGQKISIGEGTSPVWQP